jgi:UDP-2,3-diacylglucosamine pyrophosphatase LpxH
MTRLLVLSDLHISPPGPLATFHAGPALAALLHANARADTTVVLAGDIVDFLQIEDRPPVLDMPGAPALVRRTLAAVAAEPWGRAIFDALAALLRAGGRCVLLPGNHDPELHHPATRDVFLDALALPGHPGFTVHTADAPWTTVVAGLPVRVGHGHRLADPWNDIDPEAVLRAVETGDARVTLPPGSRLVLELLNPLKRAVHRSTGAQRFPFLDLLKPERATVTLLLPYLDRRAAEAHAGTFFGVVAQRFLRRFERAIRRRPVLGPEPAAEPAAALDELLADALAADLPDEDRRAPDATVRTLRTLLSGGPAPAPGTLAAHDGLLRWCARRYLRSVSQDGSFFDTNVASKEDRAIMQRELPEGSGPRVAIYGHTHAARHIDLGDGRVYLNTGTWMDLMKLPPLGDDAAAEAWIDQLEAGGVERVRRRTHALVTESGATLETWAAG